MPCSRGERQIAGSVGVSRSTVAEYLQRAGVVGITWPVPEGMDDAEYAAVVRDESRHGRSPIGITCTRR